MTESRRQLRRRSNGLRVKSTLPLYVPASATALALVMAVSMPARAQDEASPEARSDDVIGEVTVTGIRQSLESAQAIKMNAEQIVDSITAQDIGALPDRSVSEALQRIPGITLQRTNTNRDPARLASEGGGVFIRGLSWVRSETNGRDIFSANNGRDLSFEDVSADLLGGVDVYKNPSAEMIEGGIGGIVNLRTRLPFDSENQLIAFSADYNYADLMEEGFYSGNGLYSNQWDAGEGKMGALLSFSIGNIGNRTDSVQTGRFEPQTITAPGGVGGMPAGSTVYIPNALGWRQIEWEQERTAVAAAFQWAPNDSLTFTLQGLYGEADPKDIERALGDTDGGFGINPAANPGDPPPPRLIENPTFDSQGVITSGSLRDTRPTADTRYGEQHKKTSDYSFNVQFAPNERWSFSGDVQYVESSAEVLSMTGFTQLPTPTAAPGDPANSSTLDFNLSGNTPVMNYTQSPNLTGDQAAYWWAAAMDHLEDNDAQSWAERADAEYTFEDNPWLSSFRFGIRASQKEATTRQTGWNWAFLSQQFWGGGGNAPVFLDESGYGTNINPALPGASELFNFDNFFRGDVNLPGVAWFPTAATVSNGTANAYDLLRFTQSAGWGWVPLTTDFNAATPMADNPNGGINDQTEDTEAAYVLLRFARDEGVLGRFDGNIGARFVKTDVGAIGLLAITPLTNTLLIDQCIADNGAAACQALADAVQFTAGGNQPGFAQANDYTDVLPSFNIRFHLSNELQLRFAASKGIVRPTFSQMMPYSTLSYDFAVDGFTPEAVDPVTGQGGNPNLKPTRSNNYDTSLEWYFAPSGSATLALFYKDIKDYIFLGSSQETYTSNGITQTFDVTRNTNGDQGTIKGFEVAYQQFYDMLPGALSGLGFQANFTYVDSSGGRNTAINILDPDQVNGAEDETLPLEGLSETSYNVALMYEKYDISARFAYNWREEYLLTTSAANINRPVWFEDYGQLDGSVFYSFTPKLKFGVQGTNLLNTRSYLDVGGATLQPRYSWTDTDRRIAVVMRAQF